MDAEEQQHVPQELATWFNQTLLSSTWRRRRHGNTDDDDKDNNDNPEWNGRLLRCWRLQSCGSCVNSISRCGWCPYSSTCIPLPSASEMPLRWAPLAPLKHPNICPLEAERFELRTRSFGRESCNVSATTVLTALVSFLCGVAAVFVVLGVAWVLVRLVKAGRRVKNGLEVIVVEGGLPGEEWREERMWVRKWGGKWWTRQRAAEGDQEGERRALLGG